ncbi:MAG: hypothetical protein CVV47_06760 [Spirochaetae bacterium HGW-Spirochaetae-3]|jgi:hypothetical protein|nr:MAG: hypothetical protein CVV47_06760 [Spirochaetae bacterium HGW-Spirochaetae-3]
MEDRRRVLSDERPFSYRITKDGKAIVSWNGRAVVTLGAMDAARLERTAASGDEYAVQLFLAKATGNFKHGNER